MCFVKLSYLLLYVSVFGRPFIERFALCYRIVVCLFCLSCLSVTLVYCGQTAGWIRMPLGMVVGIDPGHIGLDGDPALALKRAQQPPQFSAHVCCDQRAGWIKMPLGMEVGLDPGHTVLEGDPALHERETEAPTFRPTAPARSPISATAEFLRVVAVLFLFSFNPRDAS